MKALSGKVQAGDYPNGDWWLGSGPREKTEHVTFPRGSFDRAPTVMAAISHLDASNAANVRIAVNVTNITDDHCDIKISTWADTKIAGVTVSWIAIG